MYCGGGHPKHYDKFVQYDIFDIFYKFDGKYVKYGKYDIFFEFDEFVNVNNDNCTIV